MLSVALRGDGTRISDANLGRNDENREQRKKEVMSYTLYAPEQEERSRTADLLMEPRLGFRVLQDTLIVPRIGFRAQQSYLCSSKKKLEGRGNFPSSVKITADSCTKFDVGTSHKIVVSHRLIASFQWSNKDQVQSRVPEPRRCQAEATPG